MRAYMPSIIRRVNIERPRPAQSLERTRNTVLGNWGIGRSNPSSSASCRGPIRAKIRDFLPVLVPGTSPTRFTHRGIAYGGFPILSVMVGPSPRPSHANWASFEKPCLFNGAKNRRRWSSHARPWRAGTPKVICDSPGFTHPGNDLPAFAFCKDENPAGGPNARATPLIRGCDARSAYVWVSVTDPAPRLTQRSQRPRGPEFMNSGPLGL